MLEVGVPVGPKLLAIGELDDHLHQSRRHARVLGYRDGLPQLENVYELHKGEFCATGYVPNAVEKASFYGVRMPARLFERQTPDPVIRVLSAS